MHVCIKLTVGITTFSPSIVKRSTFLASCYSEIEAVFQRTVNWENHNQGTGNLEQNTIYSRHPLVSMWTVVE